MYSLSKQATNLGAFKLARQIFDKIQTLRVPLRFQEYVDVSTILVRAKPFHDNDEILILCYRCSSYNPLLSSTSSNSCTNCKQPFVHSFVSFGKKKRSEIIENLKIKFMFYFTEVLPLVEFILEDDITDEEAVRLIETPPSSTVNNNGDWVSSENENFQTLQLDDNSSVDPFTAKLINFEGDGEEFVPVVVNRATLLALDPSGILICKRPKPLRYRFYRNVIPDLPITICYSCHKVSKKKSKQIF